MEFEFFLILILLFLSNSKWKPVFYLPKQNLRVLDGKKRKNRNNPLIFKSKFDIIGFCKISYFFTSIYTNNDIF